MMINNRKLAKSGVFVHALFRWFRISFLFLFYYLFSYEILPRWVEVGLFVLLVMVLGLLCVYYEFARRMFSYAIDETRIYVRSGIVFRKEQTVQRSKVKNVHWHTNLLAKLFGLVELVIETEGHESGELAMRFQYITQAEAMRIKKRITDSREEWVHPTEKVTIDDTASEPELSVQRRKIEDILWHSSSGRAVTGRQDPILHVLSDSA